MPKKSQGQTTKKIIKLEFERKKEQLLREKQLDITIEKRHQGLDNFNKGDMQPFVKKTKTKLKRLRKNDLIK